MSTTDSEKVGKEGRVNLEGKMMKSFLDVEYLGGDRCPPGSYLCKIKLRKHICAED